MSLPALLVCSLLSSTTTRVLVVVPDAAANAATNAATNAAPNVAHGAAPAGGPAAGAVVDAGVREGLAARAGLDVLGADATSTLLHDARDAGLSCGADDAPCWLRIATLGGLDAVVIAHGHAVVFATSTTTTQAPTTGDDAAAWASATRRALGLEGAVRFNALPAAARVVIDGVQVDATHVVAVAPGPHELVVDAAGYAPLHERIVVQAGAIVDVALALVATPVPVAAEAAHANDGASSTLFWGGLGALGVSAVGAAVLVAVGQVPYLRCYDVGAPADCATDGAITTTANTTAVAALVLGGVGLVVGSGAMAAGAALPR